MVKYFVNNELCTELFREKWQAEGFIKHSCDEKLHKPKLIELRINERSF